MKAELTLREGRNSEALAEIDEALKLAPSDPDVRITRANILNALGRAADAEAEVRHALRLEPGFSPAYQRVLALAQFNQQKYEDALATITEVVNRQSDVNFDFATMVAALGQLGRTAGVREAIAKYDEIDGSRLHGSADRPGIQLVVVPATFSPTTMTTATGWCRACARRACRKAQGPSCDWQTTSG